MTKQISDVLIHEGNTYLISSDPLDSFLKKSKTQFSFIPPHTACWKGYFCKWNIDNKKLFLTDFQGYIAGYNKVNIRYIFPDEDFIFADWYSGIIKIGIGETVRELPYATIYEKDLWLIFENGILINECVKWLSDEELKKIKQQEEEDKSLPF